MPSFRVNEDSFSEQSSNQDIFKIIYNIKIPIIIDINETNKKDLLYNYNNNSENIFDNKDDDKFLFMKNILHKLVNFNKNSII